MRMGPVNLIPAERLAARRRKARMRAWGTVCCTQVVLTAVVAMALYVTNTDRDRDLNEELAVAVQQVEQDNEAMLELRRELAEATVALETTRTIHNGPDWSNLFVGLSERLGDRIVLNRCQLVTLGADDKVIAADARGLLSGRPLAAFLNECRHKLTLNGFGLTQESVSQFVLRLEGTGLFDPVRLVGSSRQSFLSDEAVAFTIECHF